MAVLTKPLIQNLYFTDTYTLLNPQTNHNKYLISNFYGF